MSRASGTHVSAPTHPWAKVRHHPPRRHARSGREWKVTGSQGPPQLEEEAGLPELGCSCLALQGQQLVLLCVLPISFDVALPGQFGLCSQICGRHEAKRPQIPRHPLFLSSCFAIKETINSPHSA